MKLFKNVEVIVCDVCGQDTWTPCRGCGKHFCYDCQKTEGVEYAHSLHCSGTGDGFYCHTCDTDPEKETPLRRAYKALKALRGESEAYWADLKKRAAVLEKTIERGRQNR